MQGSVPFTKGSTRWKLGALVPDPWRDIDPQRVQELETEICEGRFGINVQSRPQATLVFF